jgi:hypothetical protein
MTARDAACPNCGATIRFRWSQAVQTTCEYCRSVLVRADMEWTRVGAVAELPATSSPIQLGTTGTWRKQGFTVVGRIQYRWSRGRWSEWHCIRDDGTSAWLADSQLQYVMSTHFTPSDPIPRQEDLWRETLDWNGTRYLVRTTTTAYYEGVEGELPFEYWDKTECTFVDLVGLRGGFATVDYSESPPLLYLGESVTFTGLALQHVVEFDGWPIPTAR